MFVLFFGPVVHSWAFLLSFFNFVSNFLCHPFLLTLSFLSITLPCRSHSAFVVVVAVVVVAVAINCCYTLLPPPPASSSSSSFSSSSLFS